MRSAAKPGGSLVFSCFRPREDNAWALVVDAAVGNDNFPGPGYVPGPYSLANRDFTADVLARSGWQDARARAVEFSYVAGGGDDPVGDALSFLSRIGSAARAMAGATPGRREEMRDALRRALSKHVHGSVVTFDARAWIWTAKAGDRP